MSVTSSYFQFHIDCAVFICTDNVAFIVVTDKSSTKLKEKEYLKVNKTYVSF